MEVTSIIYSGKLNHFTQHKLVSLNVRVIKLRSYSQLLTGFRLRSEWSTNNKAQHRHPPSSLTFKFATTCMIYYNDSVIDGSTYEAGRLCGQEILNLWKFLKVASNTI